ncbi:MAG TPA: hypothetical protein DCE33_10210 [Rhodospirillaceae bacterium]|nr:hypothetical protein [Rhodospirillaceae bacterium]
MERDKPSAVDLLETARSLVREEVIQEVPASQKLNLLMVANAMAIALRELDGVPELEAAAEQRLREIYSDAENEDTVTLNARFAAEIRAGRFDDDQAAYDALFENTRQRIALSNPRFLKASEK